MGLPETTQDLLAWLTQYEFNGNNIYGRSGGPLNITTTIQPPTWPPEPSGATMPPQADVGKPTVLELDSLHVILIVAVPVMICMPLLSGLLFFVYRRRLMAEFTRKAAANNATAGHRGSSVNHLQRLRQSTAPESVDRWEMSRTRITFGEIIGKGAFGQVCVGKVDGVMLGKESRSKSVRQFTDRLVAVKMLSLSAGENEQEAFLKEIQVMKDIGFHQNIISLIGCCSLSRPVWLIEEYCPLGDLRQYLHRLRTNACKRNSLGNQLSDGSPGPARTRAQCTEVTVTVLLSFARQITLGMEYLHEKGYVHRDLAARNILLADPTLVKICDFGLTRFLEDAHRYAMHTAGKLPVKWMAMESLFDYTFTVHSDVWSFGIVLFEIITLGGVPYPTIENRDLLVQLKRGHRMTRPDNCPPELYAMMSNCWQEAPSQRPLFAQLAHKLDLLIQESAGQDDYLQLDASRDYYVHTSVTATDRSDALPMVPIIRSEQPTRVDIPASIPESPVTPRDAVAVSFTSLDADVEVSNYDRAESLPRLAAAESSVVIDMNDACAVRYSHDSMDDFANSPDNCVTTV